VGGAVGYPYGYSTTGAKLFEGRDLLRHMAERTKTAIQKSGRRLVNLKNVNEAAEEYVKERYDMDISAFRGS